MPSKKTILCDVDGVLLDWTSRLPEFLKERGLPYEQALKFFATGQYFSMSDVFDCTEEEGVALSEEYTRSRYMAELHPLRDAVIYVNLLKRRYNLVAVTAVGDGIVKTHRENNLETWFPGAFSEVHCVGYGQSKLSVLTKYEPTVFIDDSPHYIREGIIAGHTTIRVDRDARTCTAPSLTARNWQEINNLIHLIRP